MKRFISVFLFAVIVVSAVSAQKSMNYFLPEDVEYNKSIPTPEDFFKQQLGEWHLTHYQVLNYMQHIAHLSGRATITEYARSHENRPLVHVIFTSEENQRKLEVLKQLHFRFSEPGENIAAESVPLVVKLGYGVHGNESSATNSSVLTAYYLAAAEGDKIEQLLNNTIILVDPNMNPDGFTRHSTWANMHQSKIAVGDNNSRQFDEVWPGGRTNHYWFDLNRDYLLLVNPESQGRAKTFYEWRPNIVTDHHEMSANSTFFFQPGVPSRNNPLTPDKNYELTNKMAKYHAQFLDKIGSSYFTEERFDDYYYGKGSSFPDVNGSVGILFEQAGYRGRMRETENGVRNFAFAIRNQFAVTLSTLQSAVDLKNEFLEFQKEFYVEALEMAKKDPVKSYIFGHENDRVKTRLFVNFLNDHQINVYENLEDLTIENKTFKAGASFFVPTEQKQFRLIKSLFEEVTSFKDSTFYDVSTWTMPYTFNIPFALVEKNQKIHQSDQTAPVKTTEGEVIGGKSNIAYLFRWNEYTTPVALYKLLSSNLIVKVATQPFRFSIENKEEKFTHGTILIPVNNQPIPKEKIQSMVADLAKETGIDFYGLETGLSPEGIDMGSNSYERLQKPEILMLIGSGVSSRDAGEIWHLFDHRYKMPVTMAENNSLNSIDLNRYNTIILPGGSYGELDNNEISKLKGWIQNGGVLIAYKSAAAWADRNELINIEYKEGAKPDSTFNFNYAGRSKERSLNLISGSIFETEMDLTHPLCYGYTHNELPVFKTSNAVVKPLENKYAQPVKFTENPYLSGYVSPQNLNRLKTAPVITVHRSGRGRIIAFHENMTFRGIWLGTNKLFSNAVFFGKIID